MNERGEQVQKLLAGLAKHADLIAEAFDGSVSGGDKQRSAGIDALFALGVLKAYDEDTYRLNPRLREFMADHFSSYHAFQALRRVSGATQQAQEQWLELRRLKSVGSTKDAARLHSALEESIVEMGYSIEHNLAMLHALISTQYGNVDDLTTKLRQNRYYARQVDQFLRDVDAIDAFVERMGDEAIGAGLGEIRLLVTRRLGAKRLHWTSQIKDAQTVLSKRLFEAKLMEGRLKRLSRFALWLARNRTSDGWNVAVDEDADRSMLRPGRMGLRPQPDVADVDTAAREGLLAAAAKMPRQASVVRDEPPVGPQMLIDDDATVTEKVGPQQASLIAFKAQVAQASVPVSLLAWKVGRPELEALSDEVWLLFAGMQLRSDGLDVTFVGALDLDPFSINERFQDVRVGRNLAGMA